MGATIQNRESSYRVRLRYKGLKDLCITFKDYDLARKWIDENELNYLENPSIYHEWLEKNRKSMKKNGLFHIYKNKVI